MKMKELSQAENRNEQFEKISVYRQIFTDINFPIISIDTKKKEMTGNFQRPRTHYSIAPKNVNDHDFQNFPKVLSFLIAYLICVFL